MSQEMHDWIAARIEASAPANNEFRSMWFVTQLAHAAATLRGWGSGQAFGMHVAVWAIPDRRALADRCLAMLARWVRFLSEEQSEQVAKMLRQLHLPVPDGLPEPSAADAPVARLFVYTKAQVHDIDTTETITDPEVVDAYVGAQPTIPIDDSPLTDVMGGERHGWWRGGEVTIVRGDDADDADALRCELAFDLAKVPDSSEIGRVLRIVEEELFFTGWGLNLDFTSDRSDSYDGVALHVDTVPIAHRLERLPSRRSAQR